MTTDDLAVIDKKLEELIQDENEYNFTKLRDKVEKILRSVDIFYIDGEIDSKAVDLYLKNVITKRNNIQKQKDKIKIDNSKETKYKLIEDICKKYEFETQEELIKKVDELKDKTNYELKEILENL